MPSGLIACAEAQAETLSRRRTMGWVGSGIQPTWEGEVDDRGDWWPQLAKPQARLRLALYIDRILLSLRTTQSSHNHFQYPSPMIVAHHCGTSVL